MRYLHFLLIIAFILTGCQPTQKEGKKPIPIALPEYKYGVRIDSTIVDSLKISNGQTLSGIFSKINITGNYAELAIQKSDSLFNLKRLIPGRDYYSIYGLKQDSIRKPNFLIIDASEKELLIYDFRDSLPKVQLTKRDVVVKKRNTSMVIKGSLYRTVQDMGINSTLAMKMAQIYDWTIDFFQIQEGDWFSVVFDEIYIEGKAKGIDKIHAVRFHFSGKDYYAFAYLNPETGKVSYYNEKGESMQTRYLKAPLDFARISSVFTTKRFHPVLKISRPHLGIDYAAPTGTPIRAIGAGTVTEAGYKMGNGNYVKIRHNKDHETQYLHMSRFASGISRGKKVAQGQVIGNVGSTGLSTGPHLCFRFWERGVQVNPKKMHSQPAEPLKKALLNDYLLVKDSLIGKLTEPPKRVVKTSTAP